MNTIADIETLYTRLGERDYEAVMSYLADDIVWIVADNSPLADRSPYHGIAEVRSGVFERLTAGFDKLVFDADEIFECNGGERVVALGYYGVLIADYWIVRRTDLDLEGLYLPDGAYRYAAGWNWKAVAATLVGCALAWGGLLWPPLKPLYDYAWFVGFGAAFVLYALLMRGGER